MVARAQQAPQEGHGPIVGVSGVAVVVCAVWLEHLSSGFVAAERALHKHMSTLFPEQSKAQQGGLRARGAAVAARPDASWAEAIFFLRLNFSKVLCMVIL